MEGDGSQTIVDKVWPKDFTPKTNKTQENGNTFAHQGPAKSDLSSSVQRKKSRCEINVSFRLHATFIVSHYEPAQGSIIKIRIITK